MKEIIFKAETRSLTGKQVKQLRKQGKLPAILYGRHLRPTTVWLDLHNANMILDRLSPSALITIDLNGEKHLSLVREKQRNFLTGSLLHVDFLVVSATETLRTSVVVELIGEAPAVKTFNGVVFNNLNEFEVEALPKDLPASIKVDVSKLAAIGDALHVRDISLPAGVKVLDDPDEIVVVITALKEEAEEVKEISTEEPEVIEKGKKEEEEGF